MKNGLKFLSGRNQKLQQVKYSGYIMWLCTKISDATVYPQAYIGTVHFSNPGHSRNTSYPMLPQALSLGVKQQGREADHSPPTIAEVKKTWFYTSTPFSPPHFMSQYLIS
jgi:hypothetical protein